MERLATFFDRLGHKYKERDLHVLVNTGVGGTGFHAHEWNAPDGPLAVQSVKVVNALAAAFPTALGGNYSFHSMLWHQGEQDAGDNGDSYHADYCTSVCAWFFGGRLRSLVLRFSSPPNFLLLSDA